MGLRDIQASSTLFAMATQHSFAHRDVGILFSSGFISPLSTCTKEMQFMTQNILYLETSAYNHEGTNILEGIPGEKVKS